MSNIIDIRSRLPKDRVHKLMVDNGQGLVSSSHHYVAEETIGDRVVRIMQQIERLNKLMRELTEKQYDSER